MYDYEVTPPPAAWGGIVSKLDDKQSGRIVSFKSRKALYYSLAAAASVIVIFFSFNIWQKKFDKAEQFVSFLPYNKIPSHIANNYNLKKITKLKKLVKQSDLLAANPVKKIQKIDLNLKDSTADAKSKTYITIAGPEGQPVKISPKVATLIDSADNSYPPNAVWNSKINKWRDIVKANTLTPTASNYLDIVELTNTFTQRDN